MSTTCGRGFLLYNPQIPPKQICNKVSAVGFFQSKSYIFPFIDYTIMSNALFKSQLSCWKNILVEVFEQLVNEFCDKNVNWPFNTSTDKLLTVPTCIQFKQIYTFCQNKS